MSRADDLRADYDLLGKQMINAEGSGLASLARERRITGELLEALESTEEVSVVDQLAARRSGSSSDSGAASRRRKPG